VERLRLEGAQVVVSDAVVALCRLGQEGDRLDLVLVDPPYEAGLYRPIAEVIVESRLLAPDGLVVMEHPAATPLDVAGLKLVEQRRYGSVALDLLEPE